MSVLITRFYGVFLDLIKHSINVRSPRSELLLLLVLFDKIELNSIVEQMGWFGVKVTKQVRPWTTPQGETAGNFEQL